MAFTRTATRVGALILTNLLLSGAVFAQEAGLAETGSPHPTAVEHLPVFITAPGQSDILFTVVVIFLLAFVLILGNLYFQLHALPERMAHRTNQVQMEIVAVLCLLALFTHNHLYLDRGPAIGPGRAAGFFHPNGLDRRVARETRRAG